MGIDYGRGLTNIDNKTGIRFGVISMHDVGESWYELSEGEYGEPTCPKCGNPASEFETVSEQHDNGVSISTIIPEEIEENYEFSKYGCSDFYCENCEYVFGSDEAYPEEALGFSYIAEGYKIFQGGDDSDLFVELSPYYTIAGFCSPCAPGAIYLTDKAQDAKAYCLGHDWFENGKAPYKVFDVKTGKEIFPEEVK